MKQHPLCTDCENPVTPLDLPVPRAIKQEWAALETRRRFLGRSGKVLGWAALAGLFGHMGLRIYAEGAAEKSPSPALNNTLGLPHFAPKAKRAIYLFMSGGPPQMDLFDYKPNLAAQFNEDMPDSVRGNQQLTGMIQTLDAITARCQTIPGRRLWWIAAWFISRARTDICTRCSERRRV